MCRPTLSRIALRAISSFSPIANNIGDALKENNIILNNTGDALRVKKKKIYIGENEQNRKKRTSVDFTSLCVIFTIIS